MSIPRVRVFWPLTITSANNAVYYWTGGAGSEVNVATTIPAGIYLSPALLAAALVAAMNAGGHGYTFTAAFSNGPNSGHVAGSEGKLFITNVGGLLWGFEWNYTTNTAATLLGFNSGTNTGYDASKVGDFQMANGWWAPTAVRTDSLDMFEQPNSVMTITVGGQNKSISEDEQQMREVEFHFLPPEKAFLAAEGSTVLRNQSIERWWRDGKARFRYWPDSNVDATYTDYFLDGSTVVDKMKPQRQYITKAVYSVGPILMRKFVS